jgi:putative transposase
MCILSFTQKIHRLLLVKMLKYIANQEEHHKRMTFREEVTKFLEEYGVEYKEDYLFDD